MSYEPANFDYDLILRELRKDLDKAENRIRSLQLCIASFEALKATVDPLAEAQLEKHQ